MKHRLVHLDFLRGFAALLVCVSHLRAFLFVDFSHLKAPGIFDRLFYFWTGLGHQAVMIFFVMSGFLVGGSVLSAGQKGQWSWGDYLLRRLTRLWMVLIPALMLTLAWDGLGWHQSSAGYHGQYHAVYNSGPTPNQPTDLTPAAFLGNVFFLQTITAPVYGTNGPLWSLANEFWYYLLFPLLLGVFAVSGLCSPLGTFRSPPSGLRRLASGLICAMLFIAAMGLLPKNILWGGVVWLMGAAVFWLIQKENTRCLAASPLWLIFSGLLALGLLAGSRFGKLGKADDLLLGAGFACLVSALAARSSLLAAGNSRLRKFPLPGFRWPASVFGLYARWSAAASEFSYTLYLVHFPLLAFVFYTAMKAPQMQPGSGSVALFTGMLAVILLYAAGVYYCFERNTDRFRKWLKRMAGN